MIDSTRISTTQAALAFTALAAYNTFNWAYNTITGAVPSFSVSEQAPEVVRAVNPFELMRTCPLSENVCGIFDNANAFFPYGEYLAQAGDYLSQAGSYIPFAAQGFHAIRAINELRQGDYLNAARRATILGTQATIQYLSPEYGIIAIPVSMVANALFDRAGRRNQVSVDAAIESIAANENAVARIFGAPTFTGESAALALGSKAKSLGNDMFQVEIEGEDIGSPVSAQVLQGLATFTSELGLVNFKKVEYNYENQTVTLDDSDIAIPFAEIESLFKLTHEDLPTLVQLGVVDLSVSDDGKVTLALNEDKLPQQKNLTYGQKSFVKLLQQQSDKALAVAANRDDFKADPKSAQEITSYLESGLVPVQTSKGVIAVSPAVVGAAVAKGLDVESTLRNPKEDGTLVLNFKVPARNRDGVVRSSSNNVEVPVREAQRVAHDVAVQVKSLYEQHQVKVNKYA